MFFIKKVNLFFLMNFFFIDFSFINKFINSLLYSILIIFLVSLFVILLNNTRLYLKIVPLLDFTSSSLSNGLFYRWGCLVLNLILLFSPIIFLLVLINFRFVTLNEELILAFIFLGFFYINFFIVL